MGITKGPWKIVGTSPLGKLGSEVISTGDGEPALVIAYKHYKEWRDNARAISKVPEMIILFKILHSKYPRFDQSDYDKISKLLAEIEGA